MPPRYLVLLALLGLCNTAYALETGRILAGLEIATTTHDFDFANTVRKTRIDSIEIYLLERLSPDILGGLRLGYQEITQHSHPLAAGQTLTGEYLDLALRLEILEGGRLDVYSELAYRYAQASGTLDSQDIDWQWHTGSAELGAELRLGPSLALIGAVGALRSTGRERATGTVNSVTDFDSSDTGYAYGGLKLLLDPHSHIGLEGSTGAKNGGRLYFQRYF